MKTFIISLLDFSFNDTDCMFYINAESKDEAIAMVRNERGDNIEITSVTEMSKTKGIVLIDEQTI